MLGPTRDRMEEAPLPVAHPRRWFWHPRRATGRLLIAAAGGLALAAQCPGVASWRLRGVIGWDFGALVLLALVGPHIATANAERTRLRAAAEDPGRGAVFVIAVLSSAFSVFAAVSVLPRARASSFGWVLLAVLAVALAWAVTHTAFTLRYAHLFYRGGGKGLTFPGTAQPSELDFAYFAFTIGMCFQVSDVAVTSTAIRRTALVHALLSFAYNTTILALVLNLVFDFLN
jgi:uncharacterized membrane protein